ncbi:hypothetical protein LCGC14_0748710 [marine sediment metagenome]|uniref:Uncharacterized protein n=1 Tax=marine sediment metagenome TaxID=412755 RepID=A0A0F9Q4M2_9ZZZZ
MTDLDRLAERVELAHMLSAAGVGTTGRRDIETDLYRLAPELIAVVLTARNFEERACLWGCHCKLCRAETALDAKLAKVIR